MKNKKEIIIIAILSIIVIAFIIAVAIKGVDSNKYLINISYEELKEKLDKEESFVLYIGRKGCSACEAFNPKFKKIINEYKITTYYLDLATYEDNEIDYVQKNISFTGTPTVVFIVDGKDSLNNNTKIVGNVSEQKIIEKLKNREYIK